MCVAVLTATEVIHSGMTNSEQNGEVGGLSPTYTSHLSF